MLCMMKSDIHFAKKTKKLITKMVNNELDLIRMCCNVEKFSEAIFFNFSSDFRRTLLDDEKCE